MNDFVNGLFEFGCALMITLNVYRLNKDKQLRGVSLIPFSFFWSWSLFNIYFYASVNCWWSWFGGVAVLTVNSVYLSQMIKYRKN